MRTMKHFLLLIAAAFIGCVGTDLIEEPVLLIPARIAITPASSAIEVGRTTSFQSTYYDSLGNAVPAIMFQWSSSDATIASINSSGLATGIKPGEVNIIATADGIASPAARLTILGASRSGAFTIRPGASYTVSSAATLEQQPDGSLVLKLRNDFSSSSGPGLEVFLSTTGTVGANSISLGRLQRTSGAQSYNVPSSVTLTTYNWVIIHCMPFNVTFGYAQLQ